MDQTMILRGVAAGYGARTIVCGLWAEFPRASVTVVLGPGGSGKSTLLRAIEGSTPDLWRSGEIPATRTWRFPQPSRARMAVVDPRRVASARAYLSVWLAEHPGALPASLQVALFASEGAMIRVSGILAADADTLLLDEPDALLDSLAGFALGAMLRAHAREGTTVVLITRNLALVAWVADHVMLLIDGVKLDEGALARVRSQPASERVREFFTWGT